MSGFERLADLPVDIRSVQLERLEQEVSSDFLRVTTTIVIDGGGFTGRGEDVTYEAEDHDGYPELPLTGSWTLAELSAHLDGFELFPQGEPGFPPSRQYRRWAIESAALDLGLRQAGTSLGAALGRDYRPVRFVMSTREDPLPWLAVDPSLEFKLDPTAEWSRSFMEALSATGRVRVLDLKAYYEQEQVDHTESVELYEAVRDLFPDAILEDASPDPELRSILSVAADRLSFDAPIHSVADIEALDVEPHCLNIKPSRFGTIERLLECFGWCEARGILMYGGGQFELGVGREHLHALASLFHPDGPNDVAPSAYNVPEVRAGLPPSPLPPPTDPVGLAFAPPGVAPG